MSPGGPTILPATLDPTCHPANRHLRAHILGCMPGTLPDGDPAPADGRLPEASARAFGARPFGVYVHVPFCRTRCGYCDFNTYTATELGGGASQAEYPALAMRELDLARQILPAPQKMSDTTAATAPLAPKIFDNSNKVEAAPGSVATVFFGGGTPTLLPPQQIGNILKKIAETFGLDPDAEVTVEANPETVTPRSLEALRKAGVTRMSFGMQSAAPHVLKTLDRVHEPGRPQQCAQWARAAGFEHVSLDLIYGTPGESDDDWRRSLDAALAAGPDHISAYALIVEDGTRLAAKVRRGEIPAPDDDALADRYLIADDMLGAAGLTWYEISNWARDEKARCRHNMLYWTGGDWWGVGPGAHSHVGGTRWWNVRHPSAYAARLAEGRSPAHGREVLTDAERRMEEIMLGVRLADGLPVTAVSGTALSSAERIMASALLDPAAYQAGRLVLTRQGRLLADAVVRDLT
jgi:putative oxygen-independent coproporphyrinogen III oxidase